MSASRSYCSFFGVLISGLALALPVLAALEDNAVLALEPQQGTVVVKTANGTLQVIGVGDAFPNSEVVVKQVLADKVIAEEVVGEANPVTQTLWVYKAENPTTGSRVERLLHQIPEYGTLVPNRIDQPGSVEQSEAGEQ